MSADEAVQSTNDDASECKRSAVRLGYWQDDYVQILVRGSDRKPPEINRGYYARTEGVNLFIKKFLKLAGEKCQIISFGAGFDTLYWRLKHAQCKFDNFTEIDFPSVTARKCYAIKRSKPLLEGLGPDCEVRLSSTELHGGNYHLVGADLRNVNEVASKMRESEVNFQLPTLFLAECVLVYIESISVANLLRWIISRFPTAMFLNYEQVNMCDRFGEIMLENLRARGCPLSGVDACLSLETQMKRFLSTDWDGAKAWTMVDIYNAIDPAERQRIEKIELLDEQELLVQLFQHYCICVGWKGQLFSSITLSEYDD
ncbi:leucine carboxyl methyltransferase [Nesidiocoris tenuis]|uniref:Leucine carboxyl methyltransferase 1 n=1 Tax=Nesidiocoris tenuis TaxID=355587 RepID=A0ABN7AMD2_9HEMI|nr:leucine carboxyl methyltransferase [Nesidiocoris tenuis]